ncbi:hypothetical protein MKW98_030648 [Papaver atlanticum]|uniref:PARP-type domain-containing protein n=1 Tax=Papaver atlanticum TaxID=357466 RepID=A0AAD4RTY4_9MAGN|nr:hypothetical protein MKW98_030648 [Papaver atlanticum]
MGKSSHEGLLRWKEVAAEYAKCNHSTCKQCTKAIPSKTLRLGLVESDSMIAAMKGCKRLMIKQKMVMDFDYLPKIEEKSYKIVANVRWMLQLDMGIRSGRVVFTKLNQ